jgi:hypothetical protein
MERIKDELGAQGWSRATRADYFTTATKRDNSGSSVSSQGANIYNSALRHSPNKLYFFHSIAVLNQPPQKIFTRRIKKSCEIFPRVAIERENATCGSVTPSMVTN